MIDQSLQQMLMDKRPKMQVVETPSPYMALSEALSREMRVKGLRYKHGMEPLTEQPRSPRGMATHKGNIY